MYINPREFFEKTNGGLDVFRFYFPDYDYGNPRAKLKLRDDEKTASAVISSYKGRWRITDFGNQQEVNAKTAIDFVMWKENMDYSDSIRYINTVIMGGSLKSEFTKTVRQPVYSFREVTPEDKKGIPIFIEKDTILDSDLKTIGRYVNEQLLKKYNCKVLDRYEICSYSDKLKRDIVHIFASTETFPIFLFDWGGFQKLYKPFDQKQYRFQYFGSKENDFVYGLQQIIKADNEFAGTDGEEAYEPPAFKPNAQVREIFRCSGETDALNLASLGYHVYWLNSESANLSYESFQEIDQLCEKHYQILDLDKTGVDQAMKIAKKHINLFTLQLPDYLQYTNDWRGNPCKDVKDYVNTIGNSLDQTAMRFSALKRRAMTIKFWSKNTDKKTGKTTININLEFLYYFLAANGFRVMDSAYHKKAGYCYARIEENVVYLIHPDEIKRIIKRFVKDWIRSKELKDEIDILNKINSSTQISESNLQELTVFNPDFYHYKKFEEYLHFNDCTLKIEPNKVSTIKNSDLKNYILGELVLGANSRISHLIDHKINNYHPNYQAMPDYKTLSADKSKAGQIKFKAAKQAYKFRPAFEVIANPEYQKLIDNYNNAKSNEDRERINTEMSMFDELDRYTIIEHDTDFFFTQFLKDMSRRYWRKELEREQPLSDREIKEQTLYLVNLLFCLGWNCAQYKDKGKPWIHVIQDLKISDVGKSSGRSGKSLYAESVDHVRPSFYKGGREKTITEKTEFIYDGYTRFHNNIHIDDFYEFGDFNFFYTQITGNREVNSKFISKQILPYEQSGKMRMTTNFELANTDASTLARILSSGISDYYHEAAISNDYLESRSPLSKYGRRLYDDFTDEEWAKFYIQVAHCIQITMRFNKISPPMGDLMKRQALKSMCKGLSKDNEFWYWANNFFIPKPKGYTDDFSPVNSQYAYYNCYISKKHCWETFKSTLPPQMASKYKATTFKQSISAFCLFYNFELNPEHLCGTNEFNRKSRRITKTIDGTSIECLYIRTLPLSASDIILDEPEVTNNSDDDLPF